ncbi:MAG: hypothetical protein ABJN20_02830 [Lentilitoribacter sp.]
MSEVTTLLTSVSGHALALCCTDHLMVWLPLTPDTLSLRVLL